MKKILLISLLNFVALDLLIAQNRETLPQQPVLYLSSSDNVSEREQCIVIPDHRSYYSHSVDITTSNPNPPDQDKVSYSVTVSENKQKVCLKITVKSHVPIFGQRNWIGARLVVQVLKH